MQENTHVFNRQLFVLLTPTNDGHHIIKLNPLNHSGMKRLLFLAFVSILSVTCYAQPFTVSLSDENASTHRFGRFRSGNSVINLGFSLSSVSGYDNAFIFRAGETSGKKGKAKKFNRGLGLSLQKIGEDFFLVYQETEKGRMLGSVMAAPVDTGTLAIGVPRVVGDFAKTGYQVKASFGQISDHKMFLTWSPDSSKIMILVSMETSADQYYVGVFDNRLQPLWERKELMNVPSNQVTVQDACVDNKGDAYVAYRILPTNKQPANTLTRVAIINKEKKWIDHALDLGTAAAKEIRLLASKDGNRIHVAGYFYETDVYKLQGAFSTYIKTDNGQTGAINKAPFPSSLMNQLAADGWASTGKDFGVSASLAPKIFELENGSVNMVAEFRSSQWGTKTVYEFSGSILNVYCSEEGIAFSRLPKKRTSAGSTIGDSFSAFAYGNQVIVFYNDEDNNLKRDISAPPFNSNVYKNVVLVAAIIEKDGKTTRHLAVDQQKENFMALSDRIEMEGSNVFWIPMYQVKALGGIKDDRKVAKIIMQ
jgi:hypothetical protein